MKLMGYFCKLITSDDNIQLDPPESKVLQSLSAQLIFTSRDTLLQSGMFDGTLRKIVESVIAMESRD